MTRRDLLAAGLALPSLGAVSGPTQPAPFALDYAPHFGMFDVHAGTDIASQLQFMHSEGFRSLEDNEMRGRPTDVQEQIGQTLSDLGMRMGVFVAHDIAWTRPNLAGGDPDERSAFVEQVRASVDVAKRVGATWMTVVPGTVDPRQDRGYQLAHMIETLKQAAGVLEPHGLVMVLEPLNFRDHPTLALTKMADAYLLCRSVGSPSCKILCDVYHQQIQEGNLIPNIDACWDEIAYIQVGDNPGRKEPTTGEINYTNVFAHLKAKGYTGIIGMEHGNAGTGKAGERAVIEAYRAVDPA
ncbi:MAG: TIM barrel protein [Bacteroidota bacterium]